jgi:hypothetical protein
MYRNVASRLVEFKNLLMRPVGLRPERGCAGDAQEKLKITDPTSGQRGRPTSTNP